SSRAALLGVVIGEHHAFAGETVDVGRLIAHHASRVGADIRLSDVVSPNDNNVGFLWLLRDCRCGRYGRAQYRHRGKQCRECIRFKFCDDEMLHSTLSLATRSEVWGPSTANDHEAGAACFKG